jgi:hypothetical protein
MIYSVLIRLKEQKKALMGKGYKTLFTSRYKEHNRHEAGLE